MSQKNGGCEADLVTCALTAVPLWRFSLSFNGGVLAFLLPVMSALKLLGYANSKPCTFLLDRASPHCQVSAAFLFRNDFHSRLDSTARETTHLTISVPTQGGYYTSSDVSLVSSATPTCDIILGADWVASCRVLTAINTIPIPTPEVVSSIMDGNTWTADGSSLAPFYAAR